MALVLVISVLDVISFCVSLYGDHRDLHVLPHSFPTRRSSYLVEEPHAPKAFPAPTPAPQEPPVVFDEPSPMDTPSPPMQRQSAPPPAPPAPAAPAPASAPADSSPMIAPPQATKSTIEIGRAHV